MTDTFFEVLEKCRGRDAFLVTASESERADHILWTVDGRFEMLLRRLISKHDTDKFKMILQI